MKTRLGVLLLVMLSSGCAHSQKEAAAPAPTPAPDGAVTEPTADFVPALQVPFPYTFSRRGVEIRVNSVEFTDNRLQVSVTLKEVRNEPGQVTPSRLMQVRTASGQELSFEGWERDGQTRQDPLVLLTPSEHFSINLIFKQPADAANDPVRIRFPTGKWWGAR